LHNVRRVGVADSDRGVTVDEKKTSTPGRSTMSPRNSYTIVCECCDLDVPERLASALVNADQVVDGWRCGMCDDHQGDAMRKAQDHAAELRLRWRMTVEELHGTQGLAEDCRAKMKAAFRARDAVLRQFERLARYHRATDDGCICGKRNCETLAVVDADWINDRIAALLRQDQAG
jgi:hypothetical protein